MSRKLTLLLVVFLAWRFIRPLKIFILMEAGAPGRRIHLSHERFRKKFAAATGVPPAPYRLLCRIDAAKRYLIRRDRSIEEISYQLGYCDPYFFSHQLKQITGETPPGVPPPLYTTGILSDLMYNV